MAASLGLLEDSRVDSLVGETQRVARRWSSARPKAERADFLHMKEMRTLEFAQAQACHSGPATL